MRSAARLALATQVLATLLLCCMQAATARPEPDADHARTDEVISIYRNAPTWVVKALSLLQLGERWHPKAVPLIMDALRDGDQRLHVFGMEALLATDEASLRVILTRELADELGRLADSSLPTEYRAQAWEVLKEGIPAFRSQSGPWKNYWRKARKKYRPLAWQDQNRPEGASAPAPTSTVASKSVTQRADELARRGIELVICIDSTGSMQPMIDATRVALTEAAGLLGGLSPNVKLGLVEYRDAGELGRPSGPTAGAKARVKLSKRTQLLDKSLGSLRAAKGGDTPERISAGLHVALDRSMGWSASAEKMVVLVGDAPSRIEDLDSALEIVRTGFRDSAWKLDPKWSLGTSRPATTGTGGSSSNSATPPIRTSAICASSELPHPRAVQHLRRLASTGGGIYVEMVGAKADKRAAASIVSSLIESAFGARYRDQVRRLIQLYQYWRSKGFFRT